MQAGKPSALKMRSRRDFIRKSSMGIMGVSLGVRAYPLFVNENHKVVLVRHQNVFGPDGHVREQPLLEMVNRGITELTGSVTLSDAWLRFFMPGDVIGLKINAISFRGLTNTPLASHYPALTNAIISSCPGLALKRSSS